jgi:hypothetical protein
MNKNTLPAGWTGNKSRHHMKVGAFTLEVIELPGMAEVWVWNIWVDKILFLNDSGRWDSPEGARDACKLALKDHLSRILRQLG